jgi:hypothetical protein
MRSGTAAAVGRTAQMPRTVGPSQSMARNHSGPLSGRARRGRYGTMNRMNPTLRYTQLGFALASLMDKEEPLEAGQARQYVEDGSLFTWLARRYDGEVDLSLFDAADREDILERFRAVSDTTDSRRNFGIESNGLALLAAWCFEVLQEMHYLGQ